MQTNSEIEDVFYKHLLTTELASAANGVIRKNGKRSAHSRQEDIVIHILTNQYGEVQEAMVLVNIYTQDTQKSGELVRNDPRYRELSKLAEKALKHVNLGHAIFEIKEQAEIDTEEGEHIAQFKIHYQHINT